MGLVGSEKVSYGYNLGEIPRLPFSPTDRLEALEDSLELRRSAVIMFASMGVAAAVMALSRAERGEETAVLVPAAVMFTYFVLAFFVFSFVSSKVLAGMRHRNSIGFKRTLTLVGFCSPWLVASIIFGSLVQSSVTDNWNVGLTIAALLFDLVLSILALIIIVSAVAVANRSERGPAFLASIVGAIVIGVLASIVTALGLWSFSLQLPM